MERENKSATVIHAGSACTSLVCMAQMGTMTAAGAASMGAMGAAAAGSAPFITLLFQSIGLGSLLIFPPVYYQILLVAVLGTAMSASYFSYKLHKNTGLFGIVIISSILLYSSIYILVSEPLYWVAFVLMLFPVGWIYITEGKARL